MAVVKEHADGITKFYVKDFPQLVLQVPDEPKGIFLGNAVLDAYLAREIAEVFEEAAKQFEKVYK